MAIPNNFIDKITDHDSGQSRDICPAADKVRVDNENFEGTDLDQVLDEVAAAIEEGGGGTVKSVSINGDTVDPDAQGNVNLGTVITQHQDISGKVDKETGKGLSTEDYTTAEKTKLAGLPTGSELTATLGNKANDADVVKGIIVGGDEVQKDSNGKVTIPAGVDGVTPHIGSNGNWWLGPETDQANDTGVKAQGPAGTSYTSADLEIGNALNGEGDVLGMGGAMTIKRNVDSLYASLNRLYGKLAAMAFWDATDQSDAEPTALDWSVPKVTVTITNSIGAGAVIKRNGTAVSGSLQVDQGDELVLTVEAADEDYELSNLAATVDGVAATLVNGTLTVEHVNSNTAIVFSGTAVQLWLTAPKQDLLDGNNNVITYGMQQGRSVAPDYGFLTAGMINNNIPQIVAVPAGVPAGTKVCTDNYVKPDGENSVVNSDPGISSEYFFATGGMRYLYVKPIFTGNNIPDDVRLAVGCYNNSVVGRTMPAYNAYVNNAVVPGWVGRMSYEIGAVGDVMTFDLHTFATSKNKTAGSITYVKLIFFCKKDNANTDSRTWIDGLTLKYRFSND